MKLPAIRKYRVGLSFTNNPDNGSDGKVTSPLFALGPDEVSSIVEQIDEILEDMKEKDILIEEGTQLPASAYVSVRGLPATCFR